MIDPRLAEDGFLRVTLRYSGAVNADRCLDERVAGDFLSILPDTGLDLRLAPAAFADIRSVAALLPRQVQFVLPERDLRRGEVIALIGDNRPDWVMGEIAAHALGCRSLGVYRDALEDEVAYLLGHSGASIVFAEDEEQVDKLLGASDRLPNLRRIIYSDPRGMRKHEDPRLMSAEALVKIGASEKTADFDALRQRTEDGSASPWLEPARINLSYVGAFLPRAVDTVGAVFAAVARLRANRPALAERMRLNFVGTSNQPGGHGQYRLTALAERIRAAHPRFRLPSLRFLLSTGEVLFAFQRRRIEETFGVPVYQEYGSQDAGLIAQEDESRTFRLNAEQMVVEVLREGKPAWPGELGEVVITHFHTEIMPFIRYATGDVVHQQEPVASEWELWPTWEAKNKAPPRSRKLAGRPTSRSDIVLTPAPFVGRSCRSWRRSTWPPRPAFRRLSRGSASSTSSEWWSIPLSGQASWAIRLSIGTASRVSVLNSCERSRTANTNSIESW